MKNNLTRLVVLIIIVAAGAYFFYGKSTAPASGKVLEKIEQKILVPAGQEPRIVLLTSVDKIKEQPFFYKAEIGDAVAVYTDTVILYRPSIDKIISMGAIDPTISAQLFAAPEVPVPTITTPVDPNTPATAPVPGAAAPAPGVVPPTTPVAQAPITLEIRNGTARSGLAKTFADKFSGNAQISNIVTGNAKDRNYAATTIINLSGHPIPDVESAFGVTDTGATLPAGEAPTDAQVLVIIGSDKL